MNMNFTEINFLAEYLMGKNYNVDYCNYPDRGRQIIVRDEDGNQLWDAITNKYSYGGEAGLIEIMGTIVGRDEEDDVVGYLTALEVIARL